MLAGPSADDVLADMSTDQWKAERVALDPREQSLSGLLARRRLVLRADLLLPFDTRSFVAGLAAGQVCREAGTDADLRAWVRPAEALDLPMLQPAETSLTTLTAVADGARSLALPYEPAPTMPALTLAEHGSSVLIASGGREPRRG